MEAETEAMKEATTAEATTSNTTTSNNALSKAELAAQIADYMQRMQECGQPPADLLKQLAPELELDDHGMPKLPLGGGGVGGVGDCGVQ